MKKYILLSVLFVSCSGRAKEKATPSYDEAFLKSFVLSSHSSNETQAVGQLDSLLKVASQDSATYRQTIAYLQEPFSNPNSSYRSQQLYSKLLQAQVDSRWYNSYEKQVAVGKLKLLRQNNVGSPANDFTYITPTGVKKTMYDVKADYVLLYFNNPECNACKEMKLALSASTIINKKLKSGVLKVLAVYTDPDEKLWLKHLKEYPKGWLQGRDENEYLYKNKVYDLRAIPTIYLLDRNKTVLLKDCLDLRQIEKTIKDK